MINCANFFNFVDLVGNFEGNKVLTYAEVIIVVDLDTIVGDIHPSAALATKILHIEAFESIVLELRVL